MKPLLAVLGVILVSSLVFTQFTSLGFPYSGKVESPTSQRGLFFVRHFFLSPVLI